MRPAPVASAGGSELRSTDRSAELAGLLVLAGSIALLLSRPALAETRWAPLVLIAVYLSIGGASLATDVVRPRRTAALRPSIVLMVGLIALGAVAWMSGSPVPIP